MSSPSSLKSSSSFIIMIIITTCHIMKCLRVEVLSASFLCSLLLHPGTICISSHKWCAFLYVFTYQHIWICISSHKCTSWHDQSSPHSLWFVFVHLHICIYLYFIVFTPWDDQYDLYLFDCLKLTLAVWPCLPIWWRNQNGNPETDSWSLWKIWRQFYFQKLTFKDEEKS